MRLAWRMLNKGCYRIFILAFSCRRAKMIRKSYAWTCIFFQNGGKKASLYFLKISWYVWTGPRSATLNWDYAAQLCNDGGMITYVKNSCIGFPKLSTRNSLKDSFTDFPYFVSQELFSSVFSVIFLMNCGSRRDFINDSSKIPWKIKEE